MPQLNTEANNLTDALEPLPADEPVLTKSRAGTKCGVKGFLATENRLTPDEVQTWVNDGGNYGFALGPETRLVVVDVEEEKALPDEAAPIRKKHALLEWRSPHGGLNWLVRATASAYELLKPFHQKKVDVDGDGQHEVELLTKVHALGPGSVLDHEHCKLGKAGCPGEGRSAYKLEASNPGAVVLDINGAQALLDALGVDPNEKQDTYAARQDWELPKYNSGFADQGEAVLRMIQHEYPAAFKTLMGLLQGSTDGYGELLVNGGSVDRSLQELVALTRLHEAIVYLENEGGEQARAVTRATFERYVTSHPRTDDGQVRKWLRRGEAYKRDRLSRAVSACDRGGFQRLLNRRSSDEEEWQYWSGDYALPTYGHVHFSLDLLTGVFDVDPEEPDVDGLRGTAAAIYEFDLDTEKLTELVENPPTPVHGITRGGPGEIPPKAYPTKSKVVEVARILDGEHNEEASYGKALNRLRQRGVAVLACVEEGVDYRYYPAHLPDPPEAEYVQTGGEKREPETAGTEVTESRLFTDV